MATTGLCFGGSPRVRRDSEIDLEGKERRSKKPRTRDSTGVAIHEEVAGEMPRSFATDVVVIEARCYTCTDGGKISRGQNQDLGSQGSRGK